MVRVTTVGDPIEARIIAARLGSEGVVWELRGGVSGPYPMGPIHVFVDEADLELASELMALADETDGEADAGRAPLALWLVVAIIVAVSVFGIGRVAFGSGMTPDAPAPTTPSSDG